MPWHIKKGSILGSAVPTGGQEYFAGDNHWTNDYDKRKVYSTEAAANADKNQTITRTLGNKTYSYTPKWFANATVVSE